MCVEGTAFSFELQSPSLCGSTIRGRSPGGVNAFFNQQPFRARRMSPERVVPRHRLCGVMAKRARAQLSGWMQAGGIRPAISPRWPLSQLGSVQKGNKWRKLCVLGSCREGGASLFLSVYALCVFNIRREWEVCFDVM